MTALPPIVGSAHPLTRVGVAHRERDLRAGVRQCPRGLDADTRRRAGDDGPLTGQVDARDDLSSGRVNPNGVVIRGAVISD